jgi:2-amino-4-hydroxy-6-hydroxymethyldihydropteridine diphosphokinase
MRKQVSTAYLGLGSNLGDRAANLLRAVAALCHGDWRLTAMSSIYETKPVDYLDQPDFLNLAVALEAPRIEPFSLLEFCLATEARLGRERTVPKGTRTIDIDLLLLDDLVVDGTRNGIALTLPHPRLHLRRFALEPLAEIAPDLIHPVFGETISTLSGRAGDVAAVSIYRK